MKWRKQHGNHFEMALPIFGEIIMKKTVVDLVATQPYVFKGAFLRLSLGLHPRKP
jgi:hypothetical protein